MKQNESLEYFHNALQDLAKTCELGTPEASLVKDLFIAKIKNKELQMKFCREKTSPDEVLKYVILYERGTQASNNFQLITKSNVQIKQEPTFSIQNRGRRQQRGGLSQRGRGRLNRTKARSDQCRNCGGKYPHKDGDCPAKGKECRLCNRIGNFECMCNNHSNTLVGCVWLYWFPQYSARYFVVRDLSSSERILLDFLVGYGQRSSFASALFSCSLWLAETIFHANHLYFVNLSNLVYWVN